MSEHVFHPDNEYLRKGEPGACINCKMECDWWLTLEDDPDEGVWRIHNECLIPFTARLTDSKRATLQRREQTMPTLRKRIQLFRGEGNPHNPADDN